jgi:cob(I)alamin adenosyltransferase
MKIYTQTGDRGKTSLLSGERVAKNHARVRAYGEVDELNAVVGMLIAALGEDSDEIREQLEAVQSDLFHAGAWLSTTRTAELEGHLPSIGKEQAARLESQIDDMSARLPELKAFILPGGHVTAAWAHMARTVCRRAERSVIDLAGMDAGRGDPEPAAQSVIAYLNRLSDYFFVLARHLNQRAGMADRGWQA